MPFPFLMKSGGLLLAATLALAAPEAPHLFQTVGESGAVVVESVDPIVNDTLVAIAERYARQFVPTGGRPSRLVLRVEQQDPAALPREPVLLLLRSGAKPDFQVTLFVGPHNPPDEWLRRMVDALLLRRAVAAGAPVGVSARAGLPAIPLWIGEGAFQSLAEEDRAAVARDVARRALFLHTTPSVETIFGWNALSDDPLLRSWQEAFCGMLYLFYRTDPARTVELDHWFQTLGGPDPVRWQVGERVEAEWLAFQQTIGRDGLLHFYSWTRTAGELAAQRTIILPGDEKAQTPVRVVAWADLPGVAGDPAFAQQVKEKIAQLTVLEINAHFAWRPVIGLYRDALAALLSPKEAPTFPARLALADRAAARLSDLDQRTADYLNWFQVTHPTGQNASAGFEDYFDLRTRFDLWSREQ